MSKERLTQLIVCAINRYDSEHFDRNRHILRRQPARGARTGQPHYKAGSVTGMDDRISEVMSRIRAYGIIKDPQWLERPDALVPLWVILEALLQVIDRFDPPNRPFD